MKSPFEWTHERYVKGRRVSVLVSWLADWIPEDASVLDVGCGDGLLAREILTRRSDLSVEGIDLLVRPDAALPVQSYDGRRFPFEDASFDTCLFIDVLHHTTNGVELLTEAARVSRRSVIIKDHRREGILAASTLRFMDAVGNARFGVNLPYNYWNDSEWESAFSRAGLRLERSESHLGLYPAWARGFFERDLHFLALLVPVSVAP